MCVLYMKPRVLFEMENVWVKKIHIKGRLIYGGYL